MSTALAPDPSIAARLRWQLRDTLVLARRNLAHVRQIPEKLIDVTLQPLMFVLLFAYVFGRVIHVPGGFHQYLFGGVAVQTLAFGMMGPGVAIATDLREGVVDRFRSLPIARSSYLLGHLLAELAAATLAIVVLSASGLLIGWRIHTDLPHALAGFALLIALAATMIWIGTLLGLLVRSPDAVQGLAFVVVFPLTFIASAFVPIGGLPGGLRTFAQYNPISAFAAAARTLFGNPAATPAGSPWPLEHPVLASVIWCVALLCIAVPGTLAAFRRRTAD
jgi:ABC transporter DrrB family efflux protein